MRMELIPKRSKDIKSPTSFELGETNWMNAVVLECVATDLDIFFDLLWSWSSLRFGTRRFQSTWGWKPDPIADSEFLDSAVDRGQWGFRVLTLRATI